MYADGKSALSYLIASPEACTFSMCVNIGFHDLLILRVSPHLKFECTLALD